MLQKVKERADAAIARLATGGEASPKGASILDRNDA